MELVLLKQLHNILKPHDCICPRACFLCEDNETVVMLPNEEELISTKREIVKGFSRHEEGFYYLDMGTECPYFAFRDNRGVCHVYDERPLDCRIFPFYPNFNLQNNSYTLIKSQGYCPISKDDHLMMRRDVRTVLDIVNVTVSQTWKQIYNKLNYQRLHKDSDRPEPMTFGHYKMEIGVKLAESRTNRADSTNLRKPSVST